MSENASLNRLSIFMDRFRVEIFEHIEAEELEKSEYNISPWKVLTR
jgi:hypothetical protein